MLENIRNRKELQFTTPLNENYIRESFQKISLPCPEELFGILKYSNGIFGEFQLGIIWQVDRIISDNIKFRSIQEYKDLYMGFNDLLFIGDAGNGDQFFLPIKNKAIRDRDVFVWNHENDSRNWVAPSISIYIEWWLDGKIQI